MPVQSLLPRAKPRNMDDKPIARSQEIGQTESMDSHPISLDELTAEERIELMGQLWDSLDPAVASPMTDALATKLDRREAAADADPEAGLSWPKIKSELEKKLR